MDTSELPAPFFFTDDTALDLLNSVASPRGSEIEWIGSGGDFLDWLGHADLAPPEALQKFREQMAPEHLDAIAAQARKLREWFRRFVTQHAGRPLETSALNDLGPINTILAADTTYAQIGPANSPDGSIFEWRHKRRWRSPDALLLPLAEAMGDLICHADFGRVKNCEGPSCTMWFNDVSKNHKRRWCDMNICGNRAKAALHRAKQQAHRQPLG